jgi:hypothetical protein
MAARLVLQSVKHQLGSHAGSHNLPREGQMKKKLDPDRIGTRIAGVLRALRRGEYQELEALRQIDDIVTQETGGKRVLSGWTHAA